jgi:hypothetical protein
VKTKRRTLIVILAMAGAAAEARAQTTEATVRAEQVVAAARQALGGEAALAAIRSIALEGDMRRQIATPDGTAEMAGTVRVAALLPDRYLRVETLAPMPGLPGVPIATGLDGEEAWAGALPAASGPHVMIRTMGSEPGAQARLGERVRRESALFLLAMLLAAPDVSWTWVATAEAPEGTADVLRAMGPGGLDAQVFVDARTHRPLMFTFADTAPRMMVRRALPGGGERAAAEAQAAAAAPPPPSEAALYLSEWKKVGGVLLPHALRKTLDGKPFEEVTVSRYVLDDPKLTADKFRKKV